MDRVLIAVDGEDQAGPATAYLIERVHGGCELEFVVITVQAPPSRSLQHTERQSRQSELHGRVVRSRRKKRFSVEGARPWLDEAGVPCQFIWETGDLSQVINRWIGEQDFQEVVVVSRQTPLPARLLAPMIGGKGASYLDRLQTRWRTRLSLITANREPDRRS